MKLGRFQRLRPDDVGKGLPEGLYEFLEPLFSQVEQITQALSRRLTLPDNADVQLIELELKNGQTYSVLVDGISGSPKDLIVTSAMLGSTAYAAAAKWKPAANADHIDLTITFTPTPSPNDSIKVRALIFGG